MKKIMELLQNMKAKNEKKDNKGFSLVELIIVIAIMAILVGVVGTQVIPYIEKSRKAKDIQVLSGLCTDAMTAYSSNASTLDASVTYRITIDKTNALSVTGGGTDDNKVLLDAFKELNSVDKTADLKLESKAGKDISKIEISCQNTGDMVTLHVTNTTTAKYSFEDIKSK
jgi:type IV pilus assembly protein PilA